MKNVTAAKRCFCNRYCPQKGFVLVFVKVASKDQMSVLNAFHHHVQVIYVEGSLWHYWRVCQLPREFVYVSKFLTTFSEPFWGKQVQEAHARFNKH